MRVGRWRTLRTLRTTTLGELNCSAVYDLTSHIKVRAGYEIMWLNGRALAYPRGKVIGGSSSINAMGYVRGHRGDYDRWAASGLYSPLRERLTFRTCSPMAGCSWPSKVNAAS